MSHTNAMIKNVTDPAEPIKIKGLYLPTLDPGGVGCLDAGNTHDLFEDHSPAEVFSNWDLLEKIQNDQVIFVVHDVDLSKDDSLEYYYSQTARNSTS